MEFVKGDKPPEIKNLKKAAERILKAMASEERIILYGDADPDGVASVIILEETIKNLGGKIAATYFPDREEEGYGVNEDALNYLNDLAPALFITLDLGIGNFKEIKLAKKVGFEVMIIDHHEVLGKLPEAEIIVDPKQKGDKYPFKEFACAGIVYKLAKLLFLQTPLEVRGVMQKHKVIKPLTGQTSRTCEPEKFLELVALATLADQMPLRDENEKFVKEGILALNYTQRAGLKALIKLNGYKEGEGIDEIRRKILSPLNAGMNARDHFSEAYLVLAESSQEKAENFARFLVQKSEEKREEIKRIFEEVESQIDLSQLIIFEGAASWPLVLLGPVASKICQRYKKPTFLYKKGKDESPGAVRMPQGLDGVKAMIRCKELLRTYGGHPPAAGFRIKTENLEKFKTCLTKYFSQ